MNEALIRQRVADLVKAIQAKDIDAVASHYAADLVSFDFTPPLRSFGADEKRRNWHQAFAALNGAIAYEVRDLKVTTNGELGFAHSVNHITASPAGGRSTDIWLRWTACFRRIDGVWLIVHDHVSVPSDPANGRAVLDLKP